MKYCHPKLASAGVIAGDVGRHQQARGRLKVFTRKVAEDASQYTLGLVKSHYPEADFEPVGDGMAPDTSDLAWSDYLTDAQPIAVRVAADLNL